MRLTKRLIDATSYDDNGKSQQILWDDEIVGLGVRVYPSGRKSFLLRYRTDSGKRRMMALGQFGTFTLDQARDRARKLLVDVNQGGDPLGDKTDKREAPTFADVAAQYIEVYASAHRKTWKTDKSRLDNHICPVIGSLKFAEVTRKHVERLHRNMADRPVEANRVAELIRAVYAWHDPEGPNPARRIKKYKERARERFVSPSEFPRLARAIADEGDLHWRAFFALLLHTGLRKSELLTAKWHQVDLDRRTLTLDETKAGRSHIVHLSEEAVTVLRQLEVHKAAELERRRARYGEDHPIDEDNPHLFPCKHWQTKPGQPRNDPAKAWRRIRKRAELPDVTLHDLRRTHASWLAISGESLPVIAAALNHSDLQATQIYARLHDERVRQAVQGVSSAFSEAGLADAVSPVRLVVNDDE